MGIDLINSFVLIYGIILFMEKLKDYLNENNILTVFFPGLVATYPLLLVLIKYIIEHKIQFPEESSLPEIFGVGLLLFVFVFFFGIGHFIKRLAIRLLEQFLDNYLEKKLAASTTVPAESNFDKTWYEYLAKRVGQNNPIILDFYCEYVRNYHFDLTCILAILCQIALMWTFDQRYYHLFPINWEIFITISYAIIIAWLFYQSIRSSRELHNLRKKIIALA